ncbi:MAG: hypothetical protein IJZ51_04245 [Ruminiclostridium sp.]|nr:hypothetical protein [Ruminiclostridium sp.]
MGQIVRVSCEGCGKSEELHIGGGMMDCDFDSIISGMSDQQKDNLREAMHLGAKDFSINRHPCQCQSCGSFYTGSKVSFFLDGEKKAVWSRCPSCTSFKRRLLNKEGTTPCSECGEKVNVQMLGFWD